MVGAEAAARRAIPSRSAAWLVAYPLLGAAAIFDSAPGPSRQRAGWVPALLLGVPLALVGYPLGCALLGHKANQAPPDRIVLEAVALAGAVAPVEEVIWGRLVERRLGIGSTAMLFAAKHVVIDRRWRRAVGLALFWVGLGLVRRRSPALALGLHAAANGSGVLLGHLAGRDSF